MYLDVAIDEESSMVTKEPDVEYTEVVHPRPVDPARGKNSTITQTIIIYMHCFSDTKLSVSNFVLLFFFCTISLSIQSTFTRSFFTHIPL